MTRWRTGGPAYVLMAIAYPIAWLLAATGGASDRLALSMEDDAFYYALVAQNLAAGEGSTFGTLNPTNGYQPLWQVAVALLGLLGTGNTLLWLMFALQAALFSALVALCWVIAKRLDARIEGACALAYCGLVTLAFAVLTFAGMETVLLLVAALTFVAVVLRAPDPDGDTGQGSVPVSHWIALGASALFLALSRLDAAALPLCYGVMFAVRQRNWAATKPLVLVSGGVLAAGLGCYAVVNLVVFETPVPVSGLAKAIGGGTRFVDLTMAYLTHGTFVGVQAIAVTVGALVLLVRGRRASAPVFDTRSDTVLVDVLSASLLAQVVQLAYYGATTTWPWWEWYFYHVPVQLFLGMLVVMRASSRARLRLLARPASAYVAVVVAIAVVPLGIRGSRGPEVTWFEATPSVAAWLRANTERGDVLAVGDRAGYLTWLTERPTLQLEGLVEDVGVLDDIRHQRLADRMTAEGVQYYIRGESRESRDLRRPAGEPNCSSVLEPVHGYGPKSGVVVCDRDLVFESTQDDDSTWEVWRYRPELQTPAR